MKKLFAICIIGFLSISVSIAQDVYSVPISGIRCSDPFILPEKSDNTYYMYSTGGGGRVMSRASKDLVNWTEPFEVMKFPDEHWAGNRAASWATEVHKYNGKYYLFTTSHTREIMETIPGRGDIPHRATQIYVSDSPRGPFRDFTDNKPHTPWNWAALDGTLWIEDGIPYMVFCHEWLQTVDGTMEAVRLPLDLGVPREAPFTLFTASEAVWSGEMLELGEKTNGEDIGGNVTDGPWLFRTGTGRLGMLWSTWSKERYAIGVAYSQSGSIKGPWIQEDRPIFNDNGGHGMLFRTFGGKLKLCMHWVDQRDEYPGRRPVFMDVDDSRDRIVLLPEKKPEVFHFDKTKVMAGRKISLKKFDEKFPSDWSPYNFLVLEMTSSTAQRVYLGLTTDEGYNELRLIFYAPKGWIRTAIPLTYFRDLPTGAHDLAATYNHKRPLTYINIDHGTRHDLKGVDSIGFRMHMPVRDEKIEVAKAYLTVGDPGDKYLSTVPAVDEFGQWALGEFEGKVHSEGELKAAWATEDAAIAAIKNTRLSKYGGDLSRKTAAKGFFYVKMIGGKWWFVDPEGYLFLSISSNGMSPGGGGLVRNPIKGIYTDKAPEGFIAPDPAQTGRGFGGRRPEPRRDFRGREIPDTYIWLTAWNQYRRFGTVNVQAKANQLLVDRMSLWGMNTIGNWSGRDLINLNQKPFMISLSGVGIQNGILGMPDVYTDDFIRTIEEGVKRSVEPFVDNKMLIGYFIGNEPTWSNKELRLCELIDQAEEERPIRKAMKAYLAKHGDTPANRKAFVYVTYEVFLATVRDALKKHDPNHLNLGIRYGSGVPSDEVLKLSKKYFDVYSFNNYGVEPNFRNMDIIYKATGMPMIIGEFHFGTTDRGLGESLVRVISQKDRGIAYRNYSEKAFSHKALIGVSWFTWYDQPFFGRGDGENYNIGIIDATDRPYEWMVKAIQEVSENCYDVHAGKRQPFFQMLERVGGQFPDIWEE